MAIAVGVLLGLVVGLLGAGAGLDRDRAYYPVVAIVVASYYSLFAVMGASMHALVLETLVGTAFLAAAVLDFKSSLWIVVAALAAHGLFDAGHAALFSNPGVPAWWPAFCGSIDVTMAAFLAWRLRSGRLPAAPPSAQGGPVARHVRAALVAAVVLSALPAALPAQAPGSRQQPATAPARIAVCALVPKAEVKRHLPWISALDGIAIEEEAVGSYGSSCNYPSVLVQVMPFSQGMIDVARKKGGLETVSGVGDEAYFYNNANEYAELYVRAGKQLLTLQANLDGNLAAVKPGVLALAKVFVAKLR